ncbi:MAG: hypothetical protein WKF73_04280 [Nocardioidaceae bacterium]
MAGDTAFVTYRHGEHGFELALPKGWPVDDEADGCALVYRAAARGRPPDGTSPEHCGDSRRSGG